MLHRVIVWGGVWSLLMACSHMWTQFLVLLICEYPSIYDKGHPQHMNANLQDVIWENIATELGETDKYNLLHHNTL